MVRAAVVLSAPVAVGYLLGNIGYGALVSAGALPSVTADVVGAYRSRAKRLFGALGAAVFGFALGVLTGAEAALSVPTVIVVAAVSALISDAGNNASIAALQLFVFTVLGTGQATVGVPVEISLACFAVGAAWGLAAALVGWTVRATAPERSAVAQVYLELATMLSAVAAGDDETALVTRHRLTRALNTAYDRLLSARSWLSGRDDAYRKLLNRLVASTSAIEATVAAVNEGIHPPRELIAYLTDLATAVSAGAPLPSPPTQQDERPQNPPAVEALYEALRDIDTEEEKLRRARPAARQRVWEWLLSLTSGPLTWLAATRLTVCVALAELTRFFVPTDRSYWITLTVGLVLKPDFGSVFGRAILRGVGTVVGVGIGAAALALVPSGVLLVPFLALFGAGVAFGKERHYGLLSAFATPLILLQMALSSGEHEAALERLRDTVVGCVIVLVFGYLLWPGSRRPVLGGNLADAAEAISHYSEYALRPLPRAEDRNERSRRRRRAYRELSDVRTAFQQLVVEPSAVGRQAVAWWPGIVALEQLVDAITAVAITIDRNAADAPEESEVRKVRTALAEFSLAVRTGTYPNPVELPRDERLSGVRSQLSMTLEAIVGPDLRTFRHVR